MKLSSTFASLLASLLLAISLSHAHPVQNRGSTGLTLPLKRLHNIRDTNVHPQILLQQHMNRGHRRLARMTGREIPQDVELASRIAKRGEHLGYLRPGKHHYDPTKRKVAHGHHKGGTAPASAPAASPAANSGTPVISPIDVAAAESQTLTQANPPSDPTDSLGLDIDANDTGYVATVSIGTPPQDFLILMDSGSSDFWVAATDCQVLQSEGGGPCTSTHKSLGSTTSSTFTSTGQQFEVEYGSGEVSGTIITDDVTLAGQALPAHTFGVADVESTDFSDPDIVFDGLMGLAKHTLSEQGVPTPVESLFSANLIPAPITSFKLSRLADQLNDGEITFGSLDSTKFIASTLTTLPNVNPDGFWEAAMDAVTVGGQSAGLSGRTAILDTGTTLIIAPPSDAAAVHALIPGAASDGQGGFTIPCTTNVTVALEFGGTSFAIDPRDILFTPVNPDDLQGDCVSGISSGEVGGADEWLVGDVFLKNAYFSVNEQTNAIQLAKLT